MYIINVSWVLYILCFVTVGSYAHTCVSNETLCEGANVECLNGGSAFIDTYECQAGHQACPMSPQEATWSLSEPVCLCPEGTIGVDCSVRAPSATACPSTQVWDGTYLNHALEEKHAVCEIELVNDAFLPLFMMADHTVNILFVNHGYKYEDNLDIMLADLHFTVNSRLVNFSASADTCEPGCSPGINCDGCQCTPVEAVIECVFAQCEGQVFFDGEQTEGASSEYAYYSQCETFTCQVCDHPNTQCALYSVMENVIDVEMTLTPGNSTDSYALSELRLLIDVIGETNFRMNCSTGTCVDSIIYTSSLYIPTKQVFQSTIAVIVIVACTLVLILIIIPALLAARHVSTKGIPSLQEEDSKVLVAPKGNHEMVVIHQEKKKETKSAAGDDDFEKKKDRAAASNKNTTISFSDITYTIGDTSILRGVSGYVKPGYMCAVIGPSGCGKTTLLELLARERSNVTQGGDVCITHQSGQEPRVGFVTQFDHLKATESVFEAVYFSARLRLQSTFSEVEISERVVQILNQLHIAHLATRLIGDPDTGGLSGGQRRRVSIAMEMVAGPAVLLLDEPTTGLDSTAAYSLMNLLRNIANQGCGCLFTVHQMPSSTLSIIDRLLVISVHGDTAYFGPAASVSLKSQSHDDDDQSADRDNKDNEDVDQKKAIMNPDDIAIDKAGVVSYLDSVELPLPDWTNPADYLLELATMQDAHLHDKFIQSPWYKQLNHELDEITQDTSTVKSTSNILRAGHDVETGCCSVIGLLFLREFRTFARNPGTIYVHTLVCALLGILLGLVFYDLDDGIKGTQNRLGVLFFCVIYFSMTSMSALPTFVADRRRYWRETNAGYYRVLPYFISKAACDVLLLRIVPPFLFSIFVYFLIGLDDDGGKYITFCLVLCMLNITATFCCLFISAISSSITQANFSAVILIMFFLVFGGLFVNLESSDSVAIVSYLSFIRWGYEALAINEFRGLLFTFAPDEVDVSVRLSGETLLNNVGMDVERFEIDIILLCIYGITFAVCTMIALTCTNRNPKLSTPQRPSSSKDKTA